MRQRKHERNRKRQRGQYMTPLPLARRIVEQLDLPARGSVLEPSCGDGSFLIALADRLVPTTPTEPSPSDLQLSGLELDPSLASSARGRLADWRASHRTELNVNVYEGDFFRSYLRGSISTGSYQPLSLSPGTFDLVLGNPPFGGTFDASLEDTLDRTLGRRFGRKIKKETYAFFIVACVDLLRPGGQLAFVCSNTLLTIPTMTGLRNLLMSEGDVLLTDLDAFSSETAYPMLVLHFTKGEHRGRVRRNSTVVPGRAVRSTRNLSWGVTPDLEKLFRGACLGDRFVASSGMTTGKNVFFVREIDEHRRIREPYRFEFVDEPITVQYERDRARLGRLAPRREAELRRAEACGARQRRLHVVERREPLIVNLPDDRYLPYNKANGRLVFSEPTHCIYWADEGDAVLTFKRTGNWYLRGVGGLPYFKREGITWQLVGSRFVARYLPAGYILDSGAPCAFPRDGVERSELFFVLGWLLSDLAAKVLKTAINHTMNIQSKDFERMPYPWWVSEAKRAEVTARVAEMITQSRSGKQWSWSDPEIRENSKCFEWSGTLRPGDVARTEYRRSPVNAELFTSSS